MNGEEHAGGTGPSHRGVEIGVAVLVAGVGVQVLGGAELGGVDEEADDDDVALGSRGAHQRQVPVVEVAHRRDQPVGARQLAEGGARLGDGRDDLHTGTSRWSEARYARFSSTSARTAASIEKLSFAVGKVRSRTSSA